MLIALERRLTVYRANTGRSIARTKHESIRIHPDSDWSICFGSSISVVVIILILIITEATHLGHQGRAGGVEAE